MAARVATDLIAHVEVDLTGCRIVRCSPGVAIVTPPSGPAFEVEERRERRRLIDLRILAVHVHGPGTDAADAAVVFHHSGQLRRTGLVARLKGRDADAAAAMRDRLTGDGALEAASLVLDFTRFEVRPHDGAWRATLELMGASHVRTTFPPSSKYVRLDPQQRAALLATVAVLHDRLPGREPAAPSPSSASPRPPRAGGARHLPRRRD